jgi:hypothetical protein
MQQVPARRPEQQLCQIWDEFVLLPALRGRGWLQVNTCTAFEPFGTRRALLPNTEVDRFTGLNPQAPRRSYPRYEKAFQPLVPRHLLMTVWKFWYGLVASERSLSDGIEI